MCLRNASVDAQHSSVSVYCSKTKKIELILMLLLFLFTVGILNNLGREGGGGKELGYI